MRRKDIGIALGLLLAACTGAKSSVATSAPPVERRVMLLGATSAPAFFLAAAQGAPAVGFGSPDAKLILLGPAEQGRVPVRVHGRVTLEAFVPEDLLELRAQRAEAVQGSPVVVAPNDRLRPLGAAAPDGNVRVQVSARIGELTLGPFQGRVPLASLAATEAPPEAPEPPPGILYALPAKTPLALYREPHGDLIALVPAQPQLQLVTVTSLEQGWLAVRVGTGPYLVGYTQAPLVLQGGSTAKRQGQPASPSAEAAVPPRIAQAAGSLRRIAAGTQLSFRGKRIAVFRSEGWARILREKEDGNSDVLAAADELVTVRGLVPRERLSEVEGAPEAELTSPGGEPSELSDPSP